MGGGEVLGEKRCRRCKRCRTLAPGWPFNEYFEGLEGCWEGLGRGGKRGGRAQGHRIKPHYGDQVF